MELASKERSITSDQQRIMELEEINAAKNETLSQREQEIDSIIEKRMAIKWNQKQLFLRASLVAMTSYSALISIFQALGNKKVVKDIKKASEGIQNVSKGILNWFKELYLDFMAEKVAHIFSIVTVGVFLLGVLLLITLIAKHFKDGINRKFKNLRTAIIQLSILGVTIFFGSKLPWNVIITFLGLSIIHVIIVSFIDSCKN